MSEVPSNPYHSVAISQVTTHLNSSVMVSGVPFAALLFSVMQSRCTLKCINMKLGFKMNTLMS